MCSESFNGVEVFHYSLTSCHWMSVTNLGWTRSLFQALVIPVTLPSHFYLR